MLSSLFVRTAFLVVACATLSSAATVNIGLITFNNTGSSNTFTLFNIYNFTNIIGDSEFPVQPSIDFLSTSLEIERQGQTDMQSVAVPTTIAPAFGAHSSGVLPMSYAITRAVFRATINPMTPWNLATGGAFVPLGNQIQIVLLPSNGSTMTPDQESWYLQLTSSDDGSAVPEPSTLLLSGASFVVAFLFQRLAAARCE